MTIDELSREELLKLVRVYARNWLAHDGCWFLAAESELGMEAAISLDTKAWEYFSPVEARRIMEIFDIREDEGLDGLVKALGYRLYAAVNKQETERIDEHTVRFRMVECRVQQARQRKGFPAFPCMPVGLVEYSQFARAVNPNIRTRCVHAPPNEVTDSFCEWEFTLGGDRDRD